MVDYNKNKCLPFYQIRKISNFCSGEYCDELKICQFQAISES